VKLLGAATDQIANQHADSECHDQRLSFIISSASCTVSTKDEKSTDFELEIAVFGAA
jgi:hypothetical protein